MRKGTFSTTVFGVSALAAAAYIALTAALVLVFLWQTNRVFVDTVLETLTAEGTALVALRQSADQSALTRTISRLSDQGNARLYFLQDRTGRRLAGNLRTIPPELNDSGKQGGLFTYAFDGGPSPAPRQAVGRTFELDGGTRLIVARDIEDQRSLIGWLRVAAMIAFALLALAGLGIGYIASRGTLARVERLTTATRSIMNGDLTGRLPLEGSDDEFDRLSESLNAMLARIEQLMHGLKEVSDNIAHDLKTPLNRLRHRAEAALRNAASEDDLRAGLGETIEAADEIIKTFNALLLIARLEAGAVEETKLPVRIDTLLSDAAELYEPVAEEAGMRLIAQQFDPVTVDANRHLIGQAVINLLDNAIKYASSRQLVCETADRTQPAPPAGHLEVAMRLNGRRVEISIADDGPGISAENRARAMQRFVRLDESRSLPGTGLGLSLVAAVARLHGGELRLEDNRPGLRAILSLPASRQ